MVILLSSIFDGGVANPATIPLALLKEMYAVGNHRGHYRAFLSLLYNASSWETPTSDYPRIDIPVILMWGEKDWANSAERAHDYDLIPGADVVTIEHSGHFLAWDRPDAILSHLLKMHSPAAVSSRRDNSAG